MNAKSLSAGDFIDARCTRCRVITNHTIIAMVGDTVAKVKCNTCDGAHKYHPPKAPAKPRATASGSSTSAASTKRSQSAAAKKLSADLEEWVTFSRDADPTLAKAYDMNSGYKAGDLLDHSVFGIGIIKAIFKPNKMEVLFQDGKKLLRCKL